MGGGNLARQSKNKGFTLLEVLAVIVVLAVIAVITVPIVTNVMNDAKKSSFKTSMTNLVKAANNYYADNQLSMDSVMTFCFGLNGINCTSEELNFSGKTPEKGRLVINPDGEISLIDMSNGTYYANYDSSVDDDIVITEDNQVLNRDELTQAIKDLQEENKKIKQQLDSTTKIANTANNTANSLNSTRLNKTYPVGSIYISYSSTNPGTLFGGTWVAFGTGRTLVGINTANTNFNTVGKTGGSGSQSIKLTTANLPSHTHSIPALSGSTSSAGAHKHSLTSSDVLAYSIKGTGDILLNNKATNGNVMGTASGVSNSNYLRSTDSAGAHTHTVTTKASTSGAVGSATAFSVSTQNPYITVYMWRRTA